MEGGGAGSMEVAPPATPTPALAGGTVRPCGARTLAAAANAGADWGVQGQAFRRKSVHVLPMQCTPFPGPLGSPPADGEEGGMAGGLAGITQERVPEGRPGRFKPLKHEPM